MSKYNHAFTFGFSIITNMEDGSDVTADDARQGIIAALARMNDIELLENIGAPFDSYEEDA